jgi:hypothetical protein
MLINRVKLLLTPAACLRSVVQITHSAAVCDKFAKPFDVTEH